MRLFLGILFLLLLVLGVLYSDWGQNFIANQITKRLSRDLQSRISIRNVEIGLLNRMNLEGLLIEDQNEDTLLYAGAVQVRITDWFIFKSEAELKYIGLEDAVINLQRSDSVWNYAYLQDYFASPSANKPKKSAGIKFNLKAVELRNVAFVQRDRWVGRDMTVRFGSLNLDANNLDLSEKVIDINTLAMVRPYFALFDYEGRKPADTTVVAPTPSDTLQPWNPDSWRISAGSITIEDGRFRNDQDSLRATTAYFDGAHINFGKINGSITSVRMTGDTLRANIELATKERSGFTVSGLKTAFRLHPQLMEFAELDLKTPRSSLGNYFAMKYPSIAAMSDFIAAVTMEALFKNSTLHSDDLAYFAPALRPWNRNIQISGKASGTVDDISAQDVAIRSGANTLFAGDVSLVGLPDINNTFINLTANDFRTTYAEAVNLVPGLRSITTPDLRSAGFVKFRGSFTGFINDFVTYGTIQTALGTVVSDLNMKLPAGGVPQYSGSLSTTGFALGTFLKDARMGRLSFAGNVRGRGFTWQSLNADVNGTVRSIDFNNHTFQNITAKGRIADRTLDGVFEIADPNAEIRLNGLVNLGGKVPVFNAAADITYANLRQLGLTSHDLVLKGLFDLHFQGQTLDDFYGTASIRQASLLKDGQPLPFDSLTITAQHIAGGGRYLKVTTNELDAELQGQYNLTTLPEAFLLFLNRYYPSYIRPPRRTLPAQSFTFNITTGVIEDYIKFLDPQLTGFNNSQISGLLNLDSNTMQVRADVPQGGFEGYEFSNLQINGSGNLNRLMLYGSIDNAVVSDSLNFPVTTVSITASNDTSDVVINTGANQTLNNASLAAQVRTFSDGFKLLFQPSNLVINGKTWSIESGGELDFRKRTVVQGSVVFRETDQEIRIATVPSDIGDWNDLSVQLQKINLGDLSPLILKQGRVEGLVSGVVLLEDPQRRLNITADIRTEALKLDNDSIGALQAGIAYDNSSGMLTGDVAGTNPEQQVSATLALDFEDTANLHRDRISVAAKDYPVKILERFIGTLFTNLQGTVTGNLDILGEGGDIDYVGKASLRNGGMKVLFTQVFYRLDDATIELSETAINFGTIKLRDTLGNTATMQGKIEHEGFENMRFDIAVQTDNRPMVLLNTTYNDNQQFYGRAMGTGSFVLVGPQTDMLMNIDMVASNRDSAHITLPPSRSRESGQASFMVERKYGREMTDDDLLGSASNLTYQINLTANPMVNVEVVLDELTGDIIRGRGTGTLFMSAGTTEPLSIRGRYDIQEGSYLFTFQSFFKKPFIIRPGSNNYIEWTGDPFGATVRFDATYRAEKVSFAPLLNSGLVLSNNLAGYRGDITVVATLTGELFRPQFNFRLELPDNLGSGNEFTYAVQQIEKNPNELNKQVTYLIVFNSFAPFETSTAGGGQFNELAYNTISGLFFGEVNKRLNQLLSKIINNNDITLNFSGSLYNRDLVNTSQNFNINQGNVNVSVGKAFFDDRFIITFGSTLDVPLQSSLQQTVQYLPDVTAEWVINESGTIRANFFYRQNLDFFSGNSVGGSALRTTRTGASISYRREFDSIKEFLFGRRRGTQPQADADSRITPQAGSQ